MKKKLAALIIALTALLPLKAQNIPQQLGYTQIYDYLQELAADRTVSLTTVCLPLSRDLIATTLLEAQQNSDKLTRRQLKDLDFYLNDLSLQLNTVPQKYQKRSARNINILNWTDNQRFSLQLLQPSFQYNSKNFKLRLQPILGMDIIAGSHGSIINRTWGANLEIDIANHLSIWGSMRDHSYNGNHLHDPLRPADARIQAPGMLNTLPGAQYKEAAYGGDYSDSRYGIRAYTSWGHIGIEKECIQWGDARHGSIILSGRAPSFPMITMHAKPCKWFQFDYFHAWLISNVIDSTDYFVEEYYTDSTSKRHYRPRSKYMAATMLTFTPVRGLDLSVGNSIIYAERNMNLAYLTPFAFYKSIDHAFTKGINTENQNSQMFVNISSRNIPHLHLYGSIYIDEINTARWKKSNPQHNLFGYKVGLELTNWPLKNVSLEGEFSRVNIACYTHSIKALTYTSNSYNLGSYLGDNSQDIYVALNYRPARSLYLTASWTHATKYNTYSYVRRSIGEIIAQKPFDEKAWRNQIVELKATYEPINNIYLRAQLQWNNAQGYDLTNKAPFSGETRLDAEGNLKRFTPAIYRGQNLTAILSLTFNM